MSGPQASARPLDLAALVRTPEAPWPLPEDLEPGEGAAWIASQLQGGLGALPLPPELAGADEPLPDWMGRGWPRWCGEVRARVNPGRLDHVYRVALLAAQLAYAAGLDTRRAFAAGVLHDLARDLSGEELLALAPAEYPGDLDHPLAVHGRAARALLEQLGFTDQAVLDAVEDHVTGPRPAEAAGLPACVYVADVSEPGRGFNAEIRRQAFGDLPGALRGAIASKVTYLQGRGLEVHPRTLTIYRQLEAGAAGP